ncbi:MAG TPA: cobalamin biosynthesis protein CbiG [Caulobacteraceae bacterium]|nr:cobalamin biosynthesis protein CbiG [Caulobacteraceae bacterium]
MSRLFDAYIVAEWTAAEGRKTGDQSLWIGVVKRDVRFRLAYEAHNPGTRAEAEALLRSLLVDLRKRGQRVLLGFAFPLGLPEGTAKRLQLTGEPWAALWKFMASNVVDKADNTNNRFAVAAKMNRLMTDEARPFWGAPARFAQRWLSSTKPVDGLGDIPEMRRTDRAAGAQVKTAARSPWPMHGAGVIGGQALLGMAAVKRLTDELGTSVAVWPFGTGWRALDKTDVEPLNTLVVEVNTGLYAAKTEPGETKSAARVRACAEALSRHDDKGDLGKAFAPPKGTGEADVAAVQSEEGWILGA